VEVDLNFLFFEFDFPFGGDLFDSEFNIVFDLESEFNNLSVSILLESINDE
jgi:hypothetical protein